MRICIVTGGTGGHIYPATALASALMKKDPENNILFIGSKDRMEKEEIPALGYKYKGIDVKGMNGNIIDKFKALYLIQKAKKECISILKEFRPDIVVGFGNYISVPVIKAAQKLNIKTMIHEQNSYAGKANLLLGKTVDAIAGCYEENLNQFPKDKTRILGNPRASLAANYHKDGNVIKEFGLNPNLKTVVIVMGSLGSESVNKVLLDSISAFKNKDYQIIMVTGKKWLDYFRSVKHGDNMKIVPYIDGMAVMVNADLVVIRGGATTLSEVCALGIPSIIVPSPYVPNNHQVKNALALQNANAAIMLEEKDLTKDNLINIIDDMIKNESKRTELSNNAKKLGKLNASDEIIDWMYELVK